MRVALLVVTLGAGGCASDDAGPLTCTDVDDCGSGQACLQPSQSSEMQCAVPDAACMGVPFRWHDRSPVHAGLCVMSDASP